jgi:phospholipid/cholesterol/gamma-HCH transport system substrate-binding protein
MPSKAQVNWAKLRVSAVTVAALLILGTISYLLTGGTILEPKTTLYLYLDDATGLAQGSPVRVDGIGVGKVNRVELSGSNDPLRVVRVSMKVERERLESITVDSTAQSSSDNPIGDKFVDITSGVNPEHLAPGAEIKYKGSPELVKSIDLSQFQQQVRAIEKLLDDIDAGRTPLGQFVAGDELYNQLRDKIRGLQERMHAAADTTTAVGQALYTDTLYRQTIEPLRKLDASLAKLQSGQGTLGQALRDNQQYEQVRAQVADLRKAAESMKGAEMMNSDRVYNDWTKQVRTLIQMVDGFNASPMVTSSAVYDNLNGIAREVQGTLKDFRGNPKKYLRTKLF